MIFTRSALAALLLLVPMTLDAQRPRCGTRSTAPCTAPGRTFQAVSVGYTHSCGVAPDGVAWCWGDGRTGALGNGRRRLEQLPQRVPGDWAFVDVDAGGDFTCALTVDQAVFCWGNSHAVPGWPAIAVVPVRVALERPAASLTVGRRHACVLDQDGRASCWGWNVDGETGIGVSGVGASMVAPPTPVDTDQRFTMLSAGMGFTCGVTTEATLRCWGSNVDGILGPDAPERCGDVSPVPCAVRPVPVTIPERVKQVSSGTTHACVLTERGTIYCWGANGSGQVGAFGAGVPMVRAPSAVVVRRSGSFVAVASGGIHTCALAASRRVYCWGADANVTYGETRPEELAPRLIAGGTQFVAISTGQIAACGLDTRGRVLCWGDTILGALGTG